MKRRILALCLLLLWSPALVKAQQPPPEYRTRQSQCRHEPPTGTALQIRRTDSGTKTHGYTAERVLTFAADAGRLNGGDILICTEYGRVEIEDSDDNEVRLQIRMEGFGEGSEEPSEAAARAIAETEIRAFMTSDNGRLTVRVWHPTLGFTNPGAQPAWVGVRLQVPARGAYRVRTEAFHGNVVVRRLTLAAATLRGAVGDKYKGIPGFLFGTELDNVALAGDIDIDNLAGLPGIRAAATAQQVPLAAPIFVKARVVANSRLTAVTGGDIRIAIQPAPNLGIRAVGESGTGTVRVGIDAGVTRDTVGNESFRVRREVLSPDFDRAALRIEIRAASAPGSVLIAAVPNAPLPRPR